MVTFNENIVILNHLILKTPITNIPIRKDSELVKIKN